MTGYNTYIPIHLVTGHGGTAHITATDAALMQAQLFGSSTTRCKGVYWLEDYPSGIRRETDRYTKQGLNVTLKPFALLWDGRYVRWDAPTQWTLDPATTDTRTDDITITYDRDSLGVESVSLRLVKGGLEAADPASPPLTSPSVTHLELTLVSLTVSGSAITTVAFAPRVLLPLDWSQQSIHVPSADDLPSPSWGGQEARTDDGTRWVASPSGEWLNASHFEQYLNLANNSNWALSGRASLVGNTITLNVNVTCKTNMGSVNDMQTVKVGMVPAGFRPTACDADAIGVSYTADGSHNNVAIRVYIGGEIHLVWLKRGAYFRQNDQSNYSVSWAF